MLDNTPHNDNDASARGADAGSTRALRRRHPLGAAALAHRMKQRDAGRKARAGIVLGAATALLSATPVVAAAPAAAAFPPPPPPEVSVTITTPSNGKHTLYGPAYEVHFAASATSTSGVCCKITWSSDVDGTLGTGKTLDYAFTSPGPRTVTATATATAGPLLKGGESASVTVFADNAAPKVSIVEPSGPVNLYRNVPYKFQGEGWDDNLISGPFIVGGELPCASLQWSSVNLGTNQPGPSGTGCKRVMQFAVAGPYKVRLNATDSHGAKALTATRNVTVSDKPSNSAPSVALYHPDDGAFLDPGKSHALIALGSDVDGDPITYTWKVKDGNTTKVIGNAKQSWWTPATDVPFNCGGRTVTLTVTASDKDGSTSDSIDVYVGWGPC